MSLDDGDHDDLDDEAEEEDAADPLDTEESHITTKDDVPNTIVGQIFIKTLSGNTIALNNITTKTTIMDIKNMIEEKVGLPVKFKRIKFQGKKHKHGHTVGFYNIEKEDTL
ncbi:MAG: ubiquitin-like protein, partial [Candidatus Fonsibacter sp.]